MHPGSHTTLDMRIRAGAAPQGTRRVFMPKSQHQGCRTRSSGSGSGTRQRLGQRVHGGLRTSRRPAGALDGATRRGSGLGGASGTGPSLPSQKRWASSRPRCCPAGQLTLGGGGTNSRPPSSSRQRPPSHGSRLRVAPPRGGGGRWGGPPSPSSCGGAKRQLCVSSTAISARSRSCRRPCIIYVCERVFL